MAAGGGREAAPREAREGAGGGWPGIPRDALALLVVSAAVRLALALVTDITYDEAYYWTWSRSLDFGYFDHPPMVAWLIRLLGVRGSALACGVATVAVVQGFAAELTGRPEAGWRAAALWSVLPASVLAGVFATPDAPLMVFWAGTLWALHRRAWVAAGALAGLALLSKYTAALLLAPAAIAFLQSRHRPLRFLAGTGAALLLFAPVVAWNAARGWASFHFQLNHGLVGAPEAVAVGSAPWRFLEFAGGQVAMAGLLLPLGVAWTVRAREAPLWLRSAFLAPITVFALASLFAPSQANWASVAYLAPCAWVAASWRWTGRVTAGLGALVCLAGVLHLSFPVVNLPRDGALERTHGWQSLKALRAGRAAVAYAPNFGLAAEVAYYSGLPVAIAGHSRLTQFDFWPEPALEQGQEAIYVSVWEDPPPERLARAFQSVEGPTALAGTYRGRQLHTFHVWRLRSRQAPPDRERPPVNGGGQPQG